MGEVSTTHESGASILSLVGSFVAFAQRELLALGIACIGLVAIVPFSSEVNPEFERAQQLLDQMAAATLSIRSDTSQPANFDVARDGFGAHSERLGDGSLGTVVFGFDAGRCFVVHWQTPSTRRPRAGVLDPAMPCDGSSELMSTLPAPPFIEVFPGAVPPIDATELVSRVGAPRHGAFEPFPAERTPVWFVPTMIVLLGVVLWQLVGLTIKLLRWLASVRPALR